MDDEDDVIVVPREGKKEYMSALDKEYTLPCKECSGRSECNGRCIEYNVWWRKMHRI